MSPELEKNLKEQFPLLYVDLHNSTPQTSCMFWGIETGDGWYQLIYELSEKLELLIERWVEQNPNAVYIPKATQVKEKYGVLRFYHTIPYEEAEVYINKAEEASAKVCEDCGKEGEMSDGGWMSVRCEGCRR